MADDGLFSVEAARFVIRACLERPAPRSMDGDEEVQNTASLARKLLVEYESRRPVLSSLSQIDSCVPNAVSSLLHGAGTQSLANRTIRQIEASLIIHDAYSVRYLESGMRSFFVDVGCASGRTAAYLTIRLGFRLIGYEREFNAFEQALLLRDGLFKRSLAPDWYEFCLLRADFGVIRRFPVAARVVFAWTTVFDNASVQAIADAFKAADCRVRFLVWSEPPAITRPMLDPRIVELVDSTPAFIHLAKSMKVSGKLFVYRVHYS